MSPSIIAIAHPRARIVSQLRVIFFACLLGLGVAVSVPTPVAAWSANTYSVSDEQLLFNLTNQARASAGLRALRNDTYLLGAARWRSKDMIVRDYFSHNIPPTGEMVFAKMQRDGYCFQVAGENIGISSYPDDVATTRIQNAFMNSPTHRDNILGVAWTNMGVGTYKGADGKKTWTVLFSEPCGASVASSPTPKPTVKPTPRPTAKPTAKPTPKPTPRPTSKPTPTPATPAKSAPAATPSPSNAPTATAPAESPTPTPAPSVTPGQTFSETTATPETSVAPSGDATGPTPTVAPGGDAAAQRAVSLRVREPARDDGPFEDILRALFGGLLGL